MAEAAKEVFKNMRCLKWLHCEETGNAKKVAVLKYLKCICVGGREREKKIFECDDLSPEPDFDLKF